MKAKGESDKSRRTGGERKKNNDEGESKSLSYGIHKCSNKRLERETE